MKRLIHGALLLAATTTVSLAQPARYPDEGLSSAEIRSMRGVGASVLTAHRGATEDPEMQHLRDALETLREQLETLHEQTLTVRAGNIVIVIPEKSPEAARPGPGRTDMTARREATKQGIRDTVKDARNHLARIARRAPIGGSRIGADGMRRASSKFQALESEIVALLAQPETRIGPELGALAKRLGLRYRMADASIRAKPAIRTRNWHRRTEAATGRIR